MSRRVSTQPFPGVFWKVALPSRFRFRYSSSCRRGVLPVQPLGMPAAKDTASAGAGLESGATDCGCGVVGGTVLDDASTATSGTARSGEGGAREHRAGRLSSAVSRGGGEDRVDRENRPFCAPSLPSVSSLSSSSPNSPPSTDRSVISLCLASACVEEPGPERLLRSTP